MADIVANELAVKQKYEAILTSVWAEPASVTAARRALCPIVNELHHYLFLLSLAHALNEFPIFLHDF